VARSGKAHADGRAMPHRRRQSLLRHQTAINRHLMPPIVRVIAKGARGRLLGCGANRALVKLPMLRRGKRTLPQLQRLSLRYLSSTSMMEWRACLDPTLSFVTVQIHREAITVEKAASAPAVAGRGIERMPMRRLRINPMLQHRPSQTTRKAVHSRLNQLFAQRRLARKIHHPRGSSWQAMLSDQQLPLTKAPNSGPPSGLMSHYASQAISRPRRCSTTPCTRVPLETFLPHSHLLYFPLRTLAFEVLLL
jgi:hypothetical protein